MKRMGGAGWAVVVVLALAGFAGCTSDDSGSDAAGGGGTEKSGSPSVSAPAGPSVSEAFGAYTAAAAPGCMTAPECQDLMTAKLAAADKLKTAMQAKDPAAFAEPIRLVNLADERADHYGRDNLGAKGNSYAVDQPLRQMVTWFGEHPGL